MADIIAILKGEANAAPSRVAFRNLGKPGDNVSVKLTDNMGFSNNTYEWSHGEERISEHQAKVLLKAHEDLKNTNHLREPDYHLFTNGWILKREYGLVRLPKNDGIGVDAHGKWVLRDGLGMAVDMDKYFNDITERHAEVIGKPTGYHNAKPGA